MSANRWGGQSLGLGRRSSSSREAISQRCRKPYAESHKRPPGLRKAKSSPNKSKLTTTTTRPTPRRVDTSHLLRLLAKLPGSVCDLFCNSSSDRFCSAWAPLRSSVCHFCGCISQLLVAGPGHKMSNSAMGHSTEHAQRDQRVTVVAGGAVS